jgi:hypothetical protein
MSKKNTKIDKFKPLYECTRDDIREIIEQDDPEAMKYYGIDISDPPVLDSNDPNSIATANAYFNYLLICDLKLESFRAHVSDFIRSNKQGTEIRPSKPKRNDNNNSDSDSDSDSNSDREKKNEKKETKKPVKKNVKKSIPKPDNFDSDSDSDCSDITSDSEPAVKNSKTNKNIKSSVNKKPAAKPAVTTKKSNKKNESSESESEEIIKKSKKPVAKRAK